MEFIRSAGARTGLNAGTRSITAVLGGILVISIADSMSDALGIHLAEEADPNTPHDQVWVATISTFLTKFVFAISFAVPLLRTSTPNSVPRSSIVTVGVWIVKPLAALPSTLATSLPSERKPEFLDTGCRTLDAGSAD